MTRTLRCLLFVVLAVFACQKNEQSSVQPEKLASGSASAATGAAPADGTVSGALVPYASGQAPSAEPSEPKLTTGSELKLLDPGKEPRRELRLKAKVGQADKMKMTMTMDMAVKMGGKAQPATKLPPMVMNMLMKVVETMPNGDIRYEFSLTGTDVVTSPGTSPEVVKAIKDA